MRIDADAARTAPEERVILVDAAGRDLRDAAGQQATADKLYAHRAGLRHRAVSVFVFDGARTLLQQRAAGKYHSAGRWSNACCTHPRPGEAPLDAARRRLREEMGLACPIVELACLAYRAPLDHGWIEDEVDHLFVAESDAAPTPDPLEVADWRWIAIDELRRELASVPARFTAWLPLLLEGVLAARMRR